MGIFFHVLFTCLVHHTVVDSYHVWPSKSVSSLSNTVKNKDKVSNKYDRWTSSLTSVQQSQQSLKSPQSHNTQLYSIVEDEMIQIGAGARSSLNCEVDYLGLINFCLRTSDNGLSGPSTFKIMNEITNDVFRVIMMGYQPAIELKLLGFSNYQNDLEESDDKAAAVTYLKWLEKLLTNGEIVENFSLTGDTAGSIDISYFKGYQRLLELLRDAGCNVSKSGEGRPYPEDSNICLSILDMNRPKGVSSRTIELNTLSNCVSKVIISRTLTVDCDSRV